MRAIIVREDPQLDRIERALAQFGQYSEAERRRKACMLTALEEERAEILRYMPKRRTHRESTSSLSY